MPSTDTDRLIKEYWETVKEKYPNIAIKVTFEEFESVCKAPFRFFKTQMERTDTPTIHIKGLAKFVVFPEYIKHLIKRNKRRRDSKTISEEDFNSRNEDYQAKLKQIIEHGDSKRAEKTDQGGE